MAETSARGARGEYGKRTEDGRARVDATHAPTWYRRPSGLKMVMWRS